MLTVHKFPLGYKGDTEFQIELPSGARPLHVDFDPQGELVLWAEVNTNHAFAPAVVTVVGTGQEKPGHAGEYVSTFFSTPFVFHAFYRADV